MSNNVNSDDLKEQIRKVVREEMQYSSQGRPDRRVNVFARTQSMIRDVAASTIARSAETPMNTMVNAAPNARPSTSASSGSSGTGSKRPNPWHPNRFPATKKKTPGNKPTCTKSKTIRTLLISRDYEGRDTYPLDASMKLVNGMAKLNTDFSELEIRKTLLEIFTTKYPDLTINDFEFVSFENKLISKPVVSSGFGFDFDGIKTLIGQGRLICRLTANNQAVQDSSASSNKEENNTVPTDDNSYQTAQQIDEGKLREMFPKKTIHAIKEAYRQSGNNLHTAATILIPEDSEDEGSFLPTLERLKNKLTPQDDTKKLVIDPEDIISDSLCYYKDHSCDMKKRLRIVYKNQPASDTGGVAREFFSDLLKEIVGLYFQGDEFKLPIYNTANLTALTIIGKMVVHSILHDGPGIPVFSTAVYKYLVTEDPDSILNLLTYEDASPTMKYYIDKISDVDVDQMSQDDKDEINGVIGECGLAWRLTNGNKDRLVQYMIYHDVIGRRKLALDKLIKGLKTLSFHSEMKKNPELFQQFFVPCPLTPDTVLKCVSFDNRVSQNIQTFTKDFIRESSDSILKLLLQHATGAPIIPTNGIKIKTEESMAVDAHTCTNEILLPLHFPDYETFKAGMISMIERKGEKSFNTI